MSRRHPDAHPDRDDPMSYSLDELSREADVTTRTIRYYIAEGLLPPPNSIGRNARYSQEHLDRLRVISQLKEHYLPLKEIRSRLAGMSPGQIRRTAEGLQRQAPRPVEASAGIAADASIARALQESAPEYAAGARQPAPHVRTKAPPETRSWKRIPISGEAELLISDEAWARHGDKIGSALNWIRRMLDE